MNAAQVAGAICEKDEIVQARGSMLLVCRLIRSARDATKVLGAFRPGRRQAHRSAVGRRADGAISGSPILIQAGRANYGDPDWGDYSYTRLDPSDGTTFWTVQEYAENLGGSVTWGTWITKLKH